MSLWNDELRRIMREMDALSVPDLDAVVGCLMPVHGDICRKAIAATLLMFVQGSRGDAEMLAGTLAALVEVQVDEAARQAVADAEKAVNKDWSEINRIALRLESALPTRSIAALAVACAIDFLDGDVEAAEKHLDSLCESALVERDGGSN